MLYFVFIAKLKKVKWSDKATKDLISAWGQSHAKSKEKMQKRRLQNAAVSCIEYESISKTLHELGYNFTKRQCVQKVARLAYLYKRVRFKVSMLLWPGASLVLVLKNILTHLVKIT